MTYCFGLYGAVLLAAVALSGGAMAHTPAAPSPALQPLGIGLEGIDYPYPVHHLDLTIEGQPLRMAYMDVAPAAASNDKTVVLHGTICAVRIPPVPRKPLKVLEVCT